MVPMPAARLVRAGHSTMPHRTRVFSSALLTGSGTTTELGYSTNGGQTWTLFRLHLRALVPATHFKVGRNDRSKHAEQYHMGAGGGITPITLSMAVKPGIRRSSWRVELERL